MKRTYLHLAAAFALCASGTALAQDQKPQAKPAQPAAQPAAKPATPPAAKPAAQPAAKPAEKAPGQPSEEDMMKIMEQYGAPGENHKLLMRGVGTWSAKVKAWWAPGGPADESTGTATLSDFMGGRFVKTEYSGFMGKAPFTGVGYNGYNNASKKFESVWIDSMGTGMMMMTGSYDAAKKQMTWTGKMVDPVDNKEKTIRTVETFPSDNSMTMEMFCPGPDGKEFRNLEITYTRTGGVKPEVPARAPTPLPAEKTPPAKK